MSERLNELRLNELRQHRRGSCIAMKCVQARVQIQRAHNTHMRFSPPVRARVRVCEYF